MNVLRVVLYCDQIPRSRRWRKIKPERASRGYVSRRMLRRPHCIVALARYHVIPQAQRRLFSHSRPAALSLFGWKLSLPVPSNEPLASDIPWLFLAELGIGLPLALWTYKVSFAVVTPVPAC